MIIGGAVVTNGGGRNCSLVIENQAPVLRESDILSAKEANTPCSRIYFVIQLMYVDQEDMSAHHQTYWALVRELLAAAPSLTGIIDRISEHIVKNRYYQALKLASQLIEYEREVISRVQQPVSDV